MNRYTEMGRGQRDTCHNRIQELECHFLLTISRSKYTAALSGSFGANTIIGHP